MWRLGEGSEGTVSKRGLRVKPITVVGTADELGALIVANGLKATVEAVAEGMNAVHLHPGGALELMGRG